MEGSRDDRPQGGSRCPDEVTAAKKILLLPCTEFAAVAEKGHRRLGQRDGGSLAIRSVSVLWLSPPVRQSLAITKKA